LLIYYYYFYNTDTESVMLVCSSHGQNNGSHFNKEGKKFLSDFEGASHKAQMTTTRAPSSFSEYPF